jgi:rod shape-determining protein MreD
MSVVFTFLSLFLALVLQSTLFQIPPMTTLHPDMVVVLLMYIAMIMGPWQAALYGLAIGLVEDVVFGRFIGLYAFTFALVAYFAGLIFRLFFQKSIIILLLTVLGATGVFEIITVGISGLYEVSNFTMMTVIDYTIRTMIFNGIFALFAYSPAVTLLEKAVKRKRRLSDIEI